MRAYYSIFFIALIIKGTFGLGLFSAPSSQCCTSNNQLVVESAINTNGDNDEEDEKGCCGLDCDCLCCIHTLIKEKQVDTVTLILEQPVSQPVHFESIYTRLMQSMIWHPPKEIR